MWRQLFELATISKFKKKIVFAEKKWVEKIPTTGYNGMSTVVEIQDIFSS